MNERIVVVGDGEWPPEAIWKPLIEKADVVIALDGAADRIDCDIVIGDMDGWSGAGNPDVINIEDQDDTDLSKALRTFRVTDVFGISGGRIDHQLAAYTALFETDSDAILYFEGWCAARVPKEGAIIDTKAFSIVALFAFGKVEHIITTGLQYQLSGQSLETSTRGVHNIATGDIVEINHKGGNLLVMWEQ